MLTRVHAGSLGPEGETDVGGLFGFLGFRIERGRIKSLRDDNFGLAVTVRRRARGSIVA